MPTSSSLEYQQRVNRVVDYIRQHLADDLALERLASLANFSSFYFHRIFKAVTGDGLYQFILRQRLEQAAIMLVDHPQCSVTNIAFSCGFASQAAFARAFKNHFACSATAWRKGEHLVFSKNRKELGKQGETLASNWQVQQLSDVYIDASSNSYKWNLTMLNKKDLTVSVRTLEATPIAFIRHVGKFVGEQNKWGQLFHQLTKWGAANDVLICPDTRFYTVFHDDLRISDLSKFRADVAMSIPANKSGSGPVEVAELAGGRYAMAQLEINGDEFEQAWDLLFDHWLPNSGFQPDDRPCFERYLNDYRQHPKQKHFIELYLPVRPL
ncbi:AraC family transcriptional regulator [Salinibius halmophilus]|uniref:AraC family transcriptional regulator n=1 Tax=Salinibius halmophilus TaxID=1853216 RepID=UPI000E65F1D8|nr:GyrI-like domain-containing protein [Salinibius halmophilus]